MNVKEGPTRGMRAVTYIFKDELRRLRAIEAAARTVLSAWGDAAIAAVELPGLDALDGLTLTLSSAQPTPARRPVPALSSQPTPTEGGPQ